MGVGLSGIDARLTVQPKKDLNIWAEGKYDWMKKDVSVKAGLTWFF